jgi:hypothetical protein
VIVELGQIAGRLSAATDDDGNAAEGNADESDPGGVTAADCGAVDRAAAGWVAVDVHAATAAAAVASRVSRRRR